jgi:archaeal cell division control protein 6
MSTVSNSSHDAELTREKICAIRRKIERRNSVFSDKRFLDSLFLPSSVIGREKQTESILEFVMSVRDGLVVPFVSVYGRSGSGKSMVVKFVCQNLSDLAEYAFVNLRKSRTVFGCASLILSELGGEAPHQGPA